jgi:hypothetical protein
MFKATLIERVKGEIERMTRYTIDDFSIANETTRASSGVGATLTVSYRFEPKYSFIAVYSGNRNNSGSNVVSCRFSPGELSSAESVSILGDDGLISTFSSWLSNLLNELESVPALKEIEQQQKEISEMLKQVGSLPEEYFTREEAEQLRVKVDELEKMIQKNIQNSTEDEESIREQISTIKRDFETLKSQIPTLTKKGWSGSFMVRYHSWTKKFGNANLLKSGIQAVKGLLVDGDIIESSN